MIEALKTRLRALDANQSGAVAFLVLAAILVSLMMALVLYDTTPAARQKIEVQGAADVAAYSQSAVEARSMNMIAFANIGKRIVIGQTLFYESLWAAFTALIILAAAAAVVACAAAIISFGALSNLCEFAVKTAVEIGLMMADEAEDLASFFKRIKDYAKEDVEAFDKYQVHFQGLTPWWSWAEQYIRGMRNGAMSTAGWPVPNNAMAALPSIPFVGNLGTGIDDALPIERYENWGELCTRSYFPDLVAHLLDYALQIVMCGSDCTSDQVAYSGTRIVVYALTGLMAAGIYALTCQTEKSGFGFITATFGDETYPFKLKEPSGEPEWLQMTSNLVFAYRPGREFSTDFRRKYGFLSSDYDTNLDPLYEADGFLGMARSEITYQDGEPDMWHTAWSARMRPVAFPGEWQGYGDDIRLISAFHDAAPYLMATSLFGGLIEGALNMGAPEFNDLLKAEMMIDGVNNDYVDGISR